MLRRFALFLAIVLVLATLVPAAEAHSYKRSLYDNNSNAPADMSLFERYVASHLRSRTSISASKPVTRSMSQSKRQSSAPVKTRSPSTSSKFSHWFAAVRSYVPGTSSVDQKRAKVAFREARIGSVRKSKQEQQRAAARQRKAAAKHRHEEQLRNPAPVSRSHYSHKVDRTHKPRIIERAIAAPASPRYNPRPAGIVPASRPRAVKRDAVTPALIVKTVAPVTPVAAPSLTWELVPVDDDLSELDQDSVDETSVADSDAEDWSWKADGTAAEGDEVHGNGDDEDAASGGSLRRSSIPETIAFDERSPVKRMEVRMRSRHSPLLD